MLSPLDFTELLVQLRMGRSLILLRADTVAERRLLVTNIQNAGFRVQVVVYRHGEPPYAALAKVADLADVLILVGDEYVVGAQRQIWWQSLNTGRDALLKIPKPVIVLLDQTSMSELAAQAPDFWSGRTRVYDGETQMVSEPPMLAAEQPKPIESLEDVAVALADEGDAYLVDCATDGWGKALREILLRARMNSHQEFTIVAWPGMGVSTMLKEVNKRLGSSIRFSVIAPDKLNPRQLNEARVAVELFSQESCIEILRRRIPERFCDSKALSRIADSSGGYVKLCLKLAQEVAIYAVVNNKNKIDLKTVWAVETSYARQIFPNHAKYLSSLGWWKYPDGENHPLLQVLEDDI